GGASPHLWRNLLPAAAPGLERPRIPDRRPEPLHRGAPRGALRHRRGPFREAGPIGFASTCFPVAALRALADGKALSNAHGGRCRAREEARGARIPDRDIARRPRGDAAGPEGPDRAAGWTAGLSDV